MAHRIDTPNAGPGGTFVGGDPQSGQLATLLSADWCNDTVQEEICGFIESQGITLDKERSDQLEEALDALAFGRRFRPNELLNGAFDRWQRGASHALTTAELYTADRWFARADGSAGAGAATLSRVEFSFGQTDVPGQPVYHLRHVQTAGSTVTSPRIGQRVENVRKFLGVEVTVAFWAKSDVTLNCTLQLDRYWGTGGTAADNVLAATFTTTNVWQRFKFTVTVSGYAGQTITSSSFFELRIDLPGSTTFQFDLADVLLKPGMFAAPFPRVSSFDEDYQLLRYYEKSYADGIAPGTPGVANSAVWFGDVSPHAYGISTRYRARKGTSTITWYSPTAGTAARVDLNGAAETVSGTADGGPNVTGYPTLSTGTGAGKLVKAHWVCDSELYRL